MFDRPGSPAEVAAATLERLERFPKTHDQSYWFVTDDVVTDGRFETQYQGGSFLQSVIGNKAKLTAESWDACGTTGCAAGHTIAAAIMMGLPIETARDESFRIGTGPLAEYLLGLSPPDDVLDEAENGVPGMIDIGMIDMGTNQLSYVTIDDRRGAPESHLFDGGSLAPNLDAVKRCLQGIVDYEQEVAA